MERRPIRRKVLAAPFVICVAVAGCADDGGGAPETTRIIGNTTLAPTSTITVNATLPPSSR